MNIYKITLSSHGRVIHLIAQGENITQIIQNCEQANKNAFKEFTEHNEITTEGEILKCEKLEEIYATKDTKYFK